jgi:hypothetical protein
MTGPGDAASDAAADREPGLIGWRLIFVGDYFGRPRGSAWHPGRHDASGVCEGKHGCAAATLRLVISGPLRDMPGCSVVAVVATLCRRPEREVVRVGFW